MDKVCIKALENRTSVRRFSSADVIQRDLEDILKAGLRAPSAGNVQPWRIVVVRDQQTRKKLAMAAGGQGFVEQAPVVLVICAVPYESAERYRERGATLYVLQDTAALTQNILLASYMKGYGTCWVGAFHEDQVSEIINLPKGMRPVALIPIGKPETEPRGKSGRRPIADVIVSESF
ncbi:MAG: nitroreductase family protein [Promethearchaeota archaeon]